MSGKKGMKHYPQAVKLEAVRMFFEEGMTRAEIANLQDFASRLLSMDQAFQRT